VCVVMLGTGVCCYIRGGNGRTVIQKIRLSCALRVVCLEWLTCSACGRLRLWKNLQREPTNVWRGSKVPPYGGEHDCIGVTELCLFYNWFEYFTPFKQTLRERILKVSSGN
jgi:hypothetical protein